MMKATKIAFILEITAIAALTVMLFAGLPLPEFLPRAWHRLLHIFGAILFFGNIIIAAVWLTLAGNSRNADTFRFAAKMINITDLVFTGPGLILLLLNGSVLASAYGSLTQVPWLKQALLWFSAAGAVWIIALIPMQFRLIGMAANNIFPWNTKPVQNNRKFLIVYSVLGSASVLFVALSFAAMVLK